MNSFTGSADDLRNYYLNSGNTSPVYFNFGSAEDVNRSPNFYDRSTFARNYASPYKTTKVTGNVQDRFSYGVSPQSPYPGGIQYPSLQYPSMETPRNEYSNFRSWKQRFGQTQYSSTHYASKVPTNTAQNPSKSSAPVRPSSDSMLITITNRVESDNHAKDKVLPAFEDASPCKKRKIDCEEEPRKKSKASPTCDLQSPSSPFRPTEVALKSLDASDKLSQSMWKLYRDNRQTEAVYTSKMNLRTHMHGIIERIFPNCGLYVVGSSLTGLGANSSDMDMCLHLNDVEANVEEISILHRIRSLFRKHDNFRRLNVIPAIVPILTFEDKISGIEVDLNVNNIVGIRNTQLLTSYARIDERFPALMVVAKIWARYHNINDAKCNTLSSYSLVLMVIHYLQYSCRPAVLPCLQKLQPDKFDPDSDIGSIKLFEDLPGYTSENKQSVGELFLGLLKYYATEFNFEYHAISVRLGSLISRQEAIAYSSPKNKKAHWKYVCIEEPFELTNTARSVLNPAAFRNVRRVFIKSWQKLMKTKNLNSLFQEHF